MRNCHMVLTKLIDHSRIRKIKLVGAVAIVTSLAQIEGTNDGMQVNGKYRYTRIYRRYPDGTWKVTNFEVTRVPAQRRLCGFGTATVITADPGLRPTRREPQRMIYPSG